jgi:YidC/Oxa1 family membrane protein insertase
MGVINTILGIPLGYLMDFSYRLTGNYGLAIILFTLLTKILMMPLSLMAQKDAIIMAKIQPALEGIRARNAGNSALMLEEQRTLFKQEGYSTFKGLLPLLVQIPLILGLIHVIYNPLQHLLHLDASIISSLTAKAAQVLGVTIRDLGSSAQIKVMELVRSMPQTFQNMEGLKPILQIDTSFLGVSLTQVPQLKSLTLIYPLLSGASALALAAYQNRCYILQQNQGPLRKWSMAAFLTAFSFFFASILPAGIGLYWIAGNFLSIGVLALSNKIYDPTPYRSGTHDSPKVRLSKEEKAAQAQLKKEKRVRQARDKKRFAAFPDKQLVFYSEGSGFYKYFGGFMDYITEHSDLIIHYVTSDFQDQIFKLGKPQIETYYIGPVALIPFMMRMDAAMVVMTTPDLETFHIKRSLVRKDIEYVYIDHGMASFHLMYRKGALDHFDTIFCYGPNHISEVRETEALYGLAAKKLIPTGFPLLDSMLDRVRELGDLSNDPPIILVAPSWQKDNILESCLDQTLAPLLETGYDIIVRPHPETVKRFPALIRDLEDRYGDRLEVQKDFSSNRTVYTADLVITDWSSIAQEFSYATGKPSLFINTPMKILNPDYHRIPSIPLDISLRDQIGRSLNLDQLSGLAGAVEDLLLQKDHYKEHIHRLVRENIFDVGQGARGGGDYIIRTLKAPREAEPEAREKNPASLELIKSLRALLEAEDTSDPFVEEALQAPARQGDSRRETLIGLIRDLENQAPGGGQAL